MADNSFQSELPEDRVEAIAKVNLMTRVVLGMLKSLLKPSKELDCAVQHVEEGQMWATRSIERNGLQEDLSEQAREMMDGLGAEICAEVERSNKDPESPTNYDDMLVDASIVLSDMMRIISSEYHKKPGRMEDGAA